MLPLVAVDPFKSILVYELLEDYASGLYSIPSLVKKYGAKGLTTKRGNNPISKSQVDRMISHPFYYGFIEDYDEDGRPYWDYLWHEDPQTGDAWRIVPRWNVTATN